MNRSPFLFLMVFMLTSPASAQKGTTDPAPGGSFADLLRERWREENRQGVFLAVLPRERGAGSNGSAVVAPSGTFAELLAAQGSVSRSFGTVTAVADRRISVYSASLPPPRFDATGNPWQDRRNAVPQLLATLSAAQWREVASPRGLGFAGLSSEQKSLWETSVPNPFVFDRSTTQYVGRKTSKENTRELSESERYQVRLRVKLMSDAVANLADKSGRMPVIFHKNRSERGVAGETFLLIKNTGAYAGPQRSDDDADTVYGQPVVRREPARPKNLPPDFEHRLTTALISLAPPEDNKPLTVGALLSRVKAASGLEIYADSSRKGQTVTAFGAREASADALVRALLFATECTVRTLPPVRAGDEPLFVMAETTEPMGRIFGRFADWYSSARVAESRISSEADRRITGQNPLPLLGFDDDDPLPLSGELKQRVFDAARRTEGGARDGRSGAVTVPLTELPLSTQKEINDRAKGLADLSVASSGEGKKYDFRVRVDKVDVDCGVWLSYIAPGSGDLAGEIDGEPLAALSEWLPRKDAREDMVPLAGRAVVLHADTGGEMRALVRAAVAGKVREIWVQATPEIVALAAHEAAGSRIPVRAVVSLLCADSETPDGLPHDQNIYGKTSREWLQPDDASVVQWVTDRVRAAVRVPGIAGIVLRDIAPPGYRGASDPRSTERTNVGDIGMEYGGSERLLGFTPARRRAFLQETGRDPADISTAQLYVSAFRFDGVAFSEWLRWNEKQIAPLWSAVRQAAGDTPVLAEGEATFRGNEWAYRDGLATFVLWEKKDPKPPLAALFRNATFTTPGFTKTPETLAVVAGNATTDLPTDEILRRLKRVDKPELTVLDLSVSARPGVSQWLRAMRRSATTQPAVN